MRIKTISDGKVHEGKDATAVLTAMKNSSPFNKNTPLKEWMENVRQWSGEDLDASSAEAFLESMTARGLIEVS